MALTTFHLQVLVICFLKTITTSFQYINPVLMKAGSLFVLARNLILLNSAVILTWQNTGASWCSQWYMSHHSEWKDQQPVHCEPKVLFWNLKFFGGWNFSWGWLITFTRLLTYGTDFNILHKFFILNLIFSYLLWTLVWQLPDLF